MMTSPPDASQAVRTAPKRPLSLAERGPKAERANRHISEFAPGEPAGAKPAHGLPFLTLTPFEALERLQYTGIPSILQ